MRLSFCALGVVIDDSTIVNNVDLEIPPGQITALVGPNGSGKSTLLRTAFRALKPTSGAVFLNDDDVWRVPAKAAARSRAVVTQHQSANADFTVQEVVAMGRIPHRGILDRETKQDRLIISESLDRVDLAWAAHRMFATLSGGERQRALLARAVAQQAPLVILDEPTNHLDVRAQLDLLDLIRDLGVTVLAALHDLDHAAAYADQVAVLQRGQVVAVGEPAQVLQPELIAEVFGVRAHVGVHPLTSRPHIAIAPLNPRSTHWGQV